MEKILINITKITCCHEGCGIPWFVDIDFNEKLLENKNIFYCPNGHSQNYRGESKDHIIARLKKENLDLSIKMNDMVPRKRAKKRK